MSIIPSESGRALLLTLVLETENLTQPQLRTIEHYGQTENGVIARQVLVPDMMRLHSLHYAIQAAFGWLNQKPHRFVLPQEQFDRMTDGSFTDWKDLAGIYFRVPGAPEDSYYTNDAVPRNQSYDTWLRNRYKGPYEWDIGPFFEHLVSSRLLLTSIMDGHTERLLEEAREQMAREAEERARAAQEAQAAAQAEDGTGSGEPDFSDIGGYSMPEDPAAYLQDGVIPIGLDENILEPMEPEPMDWDALSLDEVKEFFPGSLRDLIERTRVGQILCPPEAPLVTRRQLDRMAGKADIAFAVGQHMTYPLTVELAQHEQEYNAQRPPLDVLQLQDTYERVLSETDLSTVPASSVLDYYYGPDWHVRIECSEVYTLDGYQPGTVATKLHPVVDHTGAEVMEEAQDIITDAVLENRPLCTAVRGPMLIDDIGGPAGFAEFLDHYNSQNRDERSAARRTARQQIWRPDIPSPDELL